MEEGHRLTDIGHAVQAVAEAAGFSVVREYVGHAIGTAMHEEPQVPNFGRPGQGTAPRLVRARYATESLVVQRALIPHEITGQPIPPIRPGGHAITNAFPITFSIGT